MSWACEAPLVTEDAPCGGVFEGREAMGRTEYYANRPEIEVVGQCLTV
jgi:hypothetical protein